MHHRASRFAAALAIAATSPAVAQVPYWYAGVSGGQSRTSSELVRNRESTVTNAQSVTSDFDATDTAWKAFGGYRFNNMLAIEVSYADLGRDTLTTSTVSTVGQSGAIRIVRKISGFGADAVLSAPLGTQFTVFGRIGAFRSHLEADAALTGGIEFASGDPTDRSRSVTQNETVAHAGVGLDWWFRPNAAVRLEWERYKGIGKAFAVGATGTTGEADTDAVSLGVLMRF